ncbi:GTP-binding protein HflX [Desulfurella multipotens]|uniref:GTPase HflX n=1 Tax=Desulfurella multipotens TaxID=79269 RepID=A0A1G6NAY3_9BACT|nr:GTPase HflX [Desulfurella multipotens]SDC64554.1 GTP-binding protein HflX [Desulfurella multipotens]
MQDLQEKAILVSVFLNEKDEKSLQELEELAKTAGAEVVGVLTQKRKNIDKTYYLGKGKIEELKNLIEQKGANIVIFNNELSGSQVKNIEDILNTKVIDRTNLILDIFAKHAKTKEGMLQVKLAQLKYSLTRLRGIGVTLSRLGGGIGTRGPGETQLETDIRHIKRSILHIEKQIEEIKQHRSLYRKRRQKNQIPVVAIIGYTNAGKSTLINALTNADAYVENKLFATLDPLARKLRLPNNKIVLLIDTVGFIKNLPHQLIEAFKSTLEEIKFADLILNVVDISQNDYEEKIKVTEKILSDLECFNKPVITVYNKSDLLETLPKNTDKEVYISARYKTNLHDLVFCIQNALESGNKSL